NYDVALVEGALGNRNEAVAVLQESLREREPWAVFLGVDPRMKSLQDNPRIAGFLQRIFEPEAATSSTTNEPAS
ncbi:MAG: hypothetical protein ACRD30_03745, partial [Bryobacteraceae bacterium]